MRLELELEIEEFIGRPRATLWLMAGEEKVALLLSEALNPDYHEGVEVAAKGIVADRLRRLLLEGE